MGIAAGAPSLYQVVDLDIGQEQRKEYEQRGCEVPHRQRRAQADKEVEQHAETHAESACYRNDQQQRDERFRHDGGGDMERSCAGLLRVDEPKCGDVSQLRCTATNNFEEA